MSKTDDTKEINPHIKVLRRDGNPIADGDGDTLGEALVFALDNAVEMSINQQGLSQPKPVDAGTLRKRTQLADKIASCPDGETLVMSMAEFSLLERCISSAWIPIVSSRVLAALDSEVEKFSEKPEKAEE